MRLAFFHAYPHQVAGAQRVTHALARELAARGHEPLVVVPDDGPFPQLLAADGVRVEIVRAPRAWRRYGGTLSGIGGLPALGVLPVYWGRLAQVLRSFRLDLVHCNDHRGILLGGPAARLAGLPLVWHVHGAYGSRVLNLLGAGLAHRVAVVSRATLAEQPELGRFPGRTRVLHNGLLTFEGAGDGAPPTRPVLVTGARIHPEKGLDILLRAAARLRPRFPELEVRVAGGVQPGYEAYAEELERLSRQLGLEGSVRFLGRVERPADEWAAASVYVQPSRAEPFGLGVLEAMALGVPVVASRVGGLEEVVEHGSSGLLVPPDDPEALAEAVGRVLVNTALARRLGAAGRERAHGVFSRERMIDGLLGIYEAARRRA